MSKISSIEAIQILDSRGTPTLSVRVKTEDGYIGQASVPSGASTGEHEAHELRDQDPTLYHGKGVTQAVQSVTSKIQPLLLGKTVLDQEGIDRLMIEADGTKFPIN